MIEFLVRQLQLPEYYIHILINPLPIYALLVGLIALLVAMVWRSRPAQVSALVIVLCSAAFAWPVFEFGEASYDVMYSRSDEVGDAWLSQHKTRAESLIKYFYLLAILTALAIAVPLKWPKSSMPLAITIFLFGCIVLGMGGYIAYPAGKVRHSEFRNLRSEQPPKN